MTLARNITEDPTAAATIINLVDTMLITIENAISEGLEVDFPTLLHPDRPAGAELIPDIDPDAEVPAITTDIYNLLEVIYLLARHIDDNPTTDEKAVLAEHDRLLKLAESTTDPARANVYISIADRWSSDARDNLLRAANRPKIATSPR